MIARLVVFALLVSMAVSFANSASAQQAGIQTSSSDNRFFGEGVLQVVITDPDADNDSIVEDLTVEIDADPDSGTGGSGSLTIPETSASSGRFEFFLTHVDADEVLPDDIDPINTAGVEGATGAGATAAPIITFGPGADLSVQGAEDPFEEVAFDLTVHNTAFEIDYEETAARLTLDRTAYGPGSTVYVFVNDTDANLNPAIPDRFVVDPSAGPNSDLLVLDGGTIAQAVTFEETGDNTAVFKGRYQLGSSITTGGNKAFVLTINDKANYEATLAAAENDSNNVDQVSFTIGSTSGSVTVNEQPVQYSNPVFSSAKSEYNLGETVHLTIADPDANANENTADSIQVIVESQSTGLEKTVNAVESGRDTGVFSVEFLVSASQALDALFVQAGDTVTIWYTDAKPASSSGPQDFSYQVKIASTAENGAVMSGAPMAKDITGRALTSIQSDQQVILATSIRNENAQLQPFIALIEVRDSHGVTVFLQWQSGTLNANENAEVGLSWTPGKPGSYEARTFAVSNLANPSILSQVARSTITVS